MRGCGLVLLLSLLFISLPLFLSYQRINFDSFIFQRNGAIQILAAPRDRPVDSSRRSSNTNSKNTPSHIEGIRLNKCIASLSRRAADEAIAQGRVTVNNEVAFPGTKVRYGDIIKLDSQIQYNWEERILHAQYMPSTSFDEQKFLYLKYWKPNGVTCTNDLNDKDNIIQSGKFSLYPQRIFTVGRLDKDSSGLILLTSDGRVNNALLSSKMIKEKVYIVEMDKIPREDQIEQLSSGVMITTSIQRDSGSKEVTAKTLPCEVLSLSKIKLKNSHYLRGIKENPRLLQITLIEGRNRQIRKMAEAVGLNVVALHRVTFAGITLKGLSEGNSLELSEKEMKIIQSALSQAEKK